MASTIWSVDDAAVRVDVGRPPEFTRTWFKSAMAPVLSPVPSFASARSRMSSSLRMIGTGGVCGVQMLKPSVDDALVGPSAVTGPWRDGSAVVTVQSAQPRIFVVYRSSGLPLALNWTSFWNDMWAYRSVFVDELRPFGESGATPYVSFTPTSKAARVAAAALMNEAPSAASAVCHAAVPPS